MIILDLDDTLVNHSLAQRAAAARFGECYADLIPDYDAGCFADRWKTVAEVHFQSFLDGHISYQEQRRRRLRTIFSDDTVTAEKADEMFVTVLEYYEAAWQLFPDVIDFIHSHKHHGLGVISDGAQLHQIKKLQQLNIAHHFDFILTAEATGLCKPDPRFFHRACELASVKPEEAYYIGDNLNKDALGASLAGLKGIWLNRDGKQCENVADVISPKFKTIMRLSEFVYCE